MAKKILYKVSTIWYKFFVLFSLNHSSLFRDVLRVFHE